MKGVWFNMLINKYFAAISFVFPKYWGFFFIGKPTYGAW